MDISYIRKFKRKMSRRAFSFFCDINVLSEEQLCHIARKPDSYFLGFNGIGAKTLFEIRQFFQKYIMDVDEGETTEINTSAMMYFHREIIEKTKAHIDVQIRKKMDESEAHLFKSVIDTKHLREKYMEYFDERLSKLEDTVKDLYVAQENILKKGEVFFVATLKDDKSKTEIQPGLYTDKKDAENKLNMILKNSSCLRGGIFKLIETIDREDIYAYENQK